MVMAVSGFILWFNDLALRYFPKWVSDAATAVHYYEAILATLSILIWHMYTVVFDPEVYPMDRSWITGMAAPHHAPAAEPAAASQVASHLDESISNPPAPPETLPKP